MNPRTRPRGLRRAAAVLSVLLGALLVPAGGRAAAPVRVLYAGSLVNLFEHALAPAFARATGIRAAGRPGGSVALAHLIRDRLEPADVFIGADPSVNALLERPGPGPTAPWFLTLARTAMVIAYSPRSRFAPEFRAAAGGRVPWYRVLLSPGLRLGRTDPRLDPKGYRTILLFRLAERYYHRAGLAARILGGPGNPAEIFPEEELLGRLEAGQLDAGVFYLAEALEQRLPYLALPGAINLGDPADAAAYAEAAYTDASGRVYRGSPIIYTVTIPQPTSNLSGAVRFVRFVYGPTGRALLQAHGLLPVRVLAGGDAHAVPPALRDLIQGTYRG